jgi:hypothetical protein
MTVRPARRDAFALLVVPVAWALIVGVVATIEVLSEKHKYSRGGFTDTFDPLVITRLMALPLSAVVAAVFPEGTAPEGVPYLALRAVLFVVAAFVNALVVVVVAAGALVAVRWLWVRLAGRTRSLRSEAVDSGAGDQSTAE